MKSTATLAALATLLATSSALAQYGGSYGGQWTPGPPSYGSSSVDNVGNEGQVVFGVDRVMGLYVERATETSEVAGVKSESTATATRVGLFVSPMPEVPTNLPRLSLDYFVTDGFSIGGSAGFASASTSVKAKVGGQSQETDGPSMTAFLLAPRVGFALQFDETFALWPRAGIAYFSASTTTPAVTLGGSETKTSSNGLDLTLEVPLVISPIENVAFTVAPFLDLGLSGKQETDPGGGNAKSEDDLTMGGFGLAVGFVGYFDP